MQINFNPVFTINNSIANNLMAIEAAKQQATMLPLNPTVLASLRESAKLYTTHYSTVIEGNQLNANQITRVLKHSEHFPGRERDESEVKGYYAALSQVEQYAAISKPITEQLIQNLHAIVMSNGTTSVKPTPYRDGQNMIKDSSTGAIVYLPPEAHDVPKLMSDLVSWIRMQTELPTPIVAAIAHYQFATIHPYYDGNGRTSRLLTTLILHLGGYDLKGLYSLEEYYAKNLMGYYRAISIGPSHNYYFGRANSDITSWIDYFITGMAYAFNRVIEHMTNASHANTPDHSELLKQLDPKQRKALGLFQEFETITSRQISELFGYKARAGAALCQKWVANGFLSIADSSFKNRSYRLVKKYQQLSSKIG